MSSKKEHFKDIIKNISSKKVEYIEQFSIKDLIEQLNECEVYVLGILYRSIDVGEFADKIAEAKGPIMASSNYFIDQNLNRMLEVITGWKIDDVYSVVESLQKKELIEEYINNEDSTGVELLYNSLTNDGRAVCKTILE